MSIGLAVVQKYEHEARFAPIVCPLEVGFYGFAGLGINGQRNH